MACAGFSGRKSVRLFRLVRGVKRRWQTPKKTGRAKGHRVNRPMAPSANARPFIFARKNQGTLPRSSPFQGFASAA